MHDSSARLDRLEESVLFAQRMDDELAEQIREVFDRLAALERRVAQLEMRPSEARMTGESPPDEQGIGASERRDAEPA